MIRIPQTRLTFCDVATWCDAWQTIERRRQFCAATHAAYRNAWQALPLDPAIGWIRAAEAETVTRLAVILRQVRPPRGERAGKWERLNMETKNRLWRIARDEDLASIGLGHNSRANQ
jgi:hypothetical protein